MKLGMIGLGRMGSNIVRRLMLKGHECVVYDTRPMAVTSLEETGATGAASLQDMVAQMARPRVIWLMIPAAMVDLALHDLVPLLAPGDTVIDGGNSYYRDGMRRAAELKAGGIHYLDVGTSGGVAGLDRGYCLMIGGEADTVARLRPFFLSLAPGMAVAARTPGRIANPSDAEEGFLHCGPHGAGHFVKMIHNGIEYGLMAAYAEGFNILRNANVGKQAHSEDAETTPLHQPEFYQFDMNLPEIAEVWRRGSVIESWLLDLTAEALQRNPELDSYGGHVSDSGEGRWTVQAAIEEGVPSNVLGAALFARFASRGQADFSNRVLSAMRAGFGGHFENAGK